MALEIDGVRELDYVCEVGKNPLLAYTMLHTIDKFQPYAVCPASDTSEVGRLQRQNARRHITH